MLKLTLKHVMPNSTAAALAIKYCWYLVFSNVLQVLVIYAHHNGSIYCTAFEPGLLIICAIYRTIQI